MPYRQLLTSFSTATIDVCPVLNMKEIWPAGWPSNINIMKLIVTLSFWLVVGIAIAGAEEKKEGKGKGAGGGKQQVQRVHQGQGQGVHHAAINHQGAGNVRHSNANHPNRAVHTGAAAAEHGTGAAVQHAGRAGERAQVKHFDFANGRHTNVESVTFRANNRIVGAERWHGQRYVVFRNYRSVWHDHGWWVAHYPRIVLIGGGWYFWNAGFWYPAWGYEPAASFYAYDGPIYAYHDLPPDQVVANVQEQLQTLGYYQGEVDGQLGPLTRAALADYQRDNGLYTTAAIDEPTMASLGFEEQGEPVPEQG